jgi:hypothetical protein
MKSITLKLTAITILAAAIVGLTATLRAADTETTAPTTKAKSTGEKFYGPVTAVDTNAMTFTVGDQTFAVSSKTEVTSAKDGSVATLAAAAVGEPARGSYTKGANGKLEVTKVRFGKKAGGAAGGGKAGGKKKTGATDAGAAATPK